MTVPKQHAAALAVSLALMTTGEHAVAQTAREMEFRLEAGSLVSDRPGRTPLDAMAITPALRYSDSRVSLKTRASAWLNGQAWLLGSSHAELEVYQPLMYGIRAELVANASRVFHDPLVQNDQVDASGRLHYRRERGGIWLGSGVARPLRASAVSNVNVSSGGIWTRLGPATLRGSVTSFFFTKVSGDSITGEPVSCGSALNTAPNTGSPIPAGAMSSIRALPSTGCRLESRLTDLEGSIRWEHRLLEVTMRGGHRFGDSFDATPESREWASGQVAFWISSQIAAVAGGGREPAQPTRGLPARSFGSLGVMLAYWPIPRGVVPVESPANLVQAFELRAAGTEVQRITARIGGVETVEIMGDFSDWEPLPLIRRGRDQWELLVPMPPGIHRMNLRIDGGKWIAPPGMPTVNDGFSGEVGVVVVR
ncbi:MAG TPA: glycogen-binding domain-containing protein [Gemmatimonadaceae bacterium]|nr:glycogen-binding domain-containing protein [Gemmatimonadaceae bacterium]